MRFKSLTVNALIILFSTTAIKSHANNHPAQTKDQLTSSLSLKPMSCIVKQVGDECQMVITAQWKSPKPQTACLLQDEKNLLCWQEKSSILKELRITLSEDMQFKVKNENGFIIAQQNIKIQASTSPNYRRRLRAKWSLF